MEKLRQGTDVDLPSMKQMILGPKSLIWRKYLY